MAEHLLSKGILYVIHRLWSQIEDQVKDAEPRNKLIASKNLNIMPVVVISGCFLGDNPVPVILGKAGVGLER